MNEREQNSGPAALFKELLMYKKTVLNICLGYSRNLSDAEDLVQETYLKAYINIGSLKDDSSGRGWLFKIARNACLDHLRKLPRLRHVTLEEAGDPAALDTPEVLAADREKYVLMKTAVRRLPKKQRDIFVLKEYGDLSYREIADTLGIKEGTVMSRLNRARRAVMEDVRRKIDDNRN